MREGFCRMVEWIRRDPRRPYIIALALAIVLLPSLLHLDTVASADRDAMLGVNSHWDRGAAEVLGWLSEVGSLPFLSLLVALLWISGRRELAIYLLVAVLVHVLIGASMKFAIDRPRPFDAIEGIESLIRPSTPSYPSGHTEGAFAMAWVLGLRRRGILLPLLLIAIFVGVCRNFIGVHYPLDVIAGAVIGSLVGVIVARSDLDPLCGRIESAWMRLSGRSQHSQRGNDG